MRGLEQSAVGGPGERAAGRDPAHAGRRRARRSTGRSRSASTFTGTPTASTTARDLLERRRRPGAYTAVGAGVAVGDQAGDRVVEVVDAADVVLAPAGEHHRVGEPVRRLGGLGDPLRGEPDVVDPVGRRVVVLDREAGRAASASSATVSAMPPGSSG